MFRLIALFFVGIIFYRLLSTFVYNRQVKARRKQDSGRSAQPAEFEIIDDRSSRSSEKTGKAKASADQTE